jgi:hypothetical protein
MSGTSELSEDERTTAIGLARYAFEYIEAARLIDDDHANKSPGSMISPIPAYFLAYHGIELTFKSFLRLKGVGVRQLSSKAYGHDLQACYRKAKELDLLDIFNMTANDAAAMRMLVSLNKMHGLRYIRTGMKNFPLWSLVDSLAIRLHQAVAPAVGYKTFLVTR